MFIKFSDRRINLSLVKDYRPSYKESSGKNYYSITFKFLDDSTENLNFFDRKDERDSYLEKLDKNLLNLQS